MFKTFRIISIVSIFILILSACNLPSTTPTQEANVVFTAAALTVQAQSTQLSQFSTPTLPPPPPATNTALVIPTATVAIPTATRAVPPTAACDLAEFVKDVTFPDGTVVAPGTTFKKTWRLKNSGTCTWSGYSLVFDRGESMSPVIDPIGTVAPGQEVDVSVTFTAPLANNSYRGYWRIRNSAGVLLPGSFYVDIKVATVSSGFDFYTRATSATWTSGAGNLTFGGPDTDNRGFVMYRDGQKLEGGSSPSKVLETHPQWVDNGEIRGLFTPYTVVSGEHFTARIGFLAQADGTCGAGNVKFQLNYKESGVLKPLGEWSETCDSALRSIDVDLTGLAGKTVEFELKVLANGSSSQDFAVWVAPQIALP